MKKIVIINGRGGVGKDALIKEAEKTFSIMNVSSVDKIKEVAREAGWDEKKDEKSRKFLSDLKKLCAEFNNLPQKSCEEAVIQFLESMQHDILFLHIREPENIKAMKDRIEGIQKDAGMPKAQVVTMLITRDGAGASGNVSDDSVEDYHYDYIFDNKNRPDMPGNGSLEMAGKEFTRILKSDREQMFEELWQEFGDVPMDYPEGSEGIIAQNWNGFPAGTDKEDIWRWFDKNYKAGVVKLLYSK